MTVKITKPALNLREEIAKAQSNNADEARIGTLVSDSIDAVAIDAETAVLPSIVGNIAVTGAITPSTGVYLGGTVAANLLDDYEEGTFTPSFGGQSGNPTVTYSEQVGRYTKIGHRVYFDIRLTISTVSGGSGNLEIDGLPFTSVNNAFATVSVTRAHGFTADYVNISGLVLNLSTNCFLYYGATTSGVTTIPTSGLQVGTTINLSGSYEAA